MLATFKKLRQVFTVWRPSITAEQLTDREIRNWNSALWRLHEDVVKTAVLLGESKLQVMERDIARISLCMTAQGISTIMSGYSRNADACRGSMYDDRHQALWSVNRNIDHINRVRQAIGAPHLLYLTGLSEGK